MKRLMVCLVVGIGFIIYKWTPLNCTPFQMLLTLSYHQSLSNSASVNLLIKRSIKWISKSVWVWCLAENPGKTSTSKCNHPSHVRMSDRYLHSDRAAVIYIAQQRKRQNQKAATSKSCQEFFFFPHHFISAFPTSTAPLHQPLIISPTD